ncbi:hypothetical protein HB912_01360 [Listeria aquatica]|uniref:Uncharacterized protein n=1 Tax=Listeria aquatica TaxID=1494960 RepID=A0A841ZMR2_9LIST|nr:hypothetical protein [Listeria aquatica]MBC1520290.1 hypothetical protein [Listeria aquatica]
MVLGHVKWFTTVEPVRNSLAEIWNPATIFYFILSIIFIFFFYLATPYLSKSTFLSGSSIQRVNRETVFRVGIGLAIAISMLTKHVLVPDVGGSLILYILMGIAALMLFIPTEITQITGLFSILLLFIWDVVELGIHCSIDYLFYIGIMITLFAFITDRNELKVRPLEILTGLSLLWVAAEKLVYSNMSLDIVHHYGLYTFGFSQEHFVVCAAFVEMVIGFVLITGYFRKIISFILTLVFLATNLIFGLSEILAHMPLHIIFIYLILNQEKIKNSPHNLVKTCLMVICYTIAVIVVVFLY